MTPDLSLEHMEIKKTFFDYWDHLTNFIVVNAEQNKLLDQEVRASIIDILALGIMDHDPMSGESRKRRVLNATELLAEVNERLEEKIKKSNLYFHLEKLETAGLIRVVDQIPQGKRYTTYYGRTAKAFNSSEKKDLAHMFGDLLTDNLLEELIKKISPDKNQVQVKDLIAETFDNYFRKCADHRIAEWLEKYQEAALRLEIDLRKLYSIFDVFSKYNRETIEAVYELADLMDFPIKK